MARTADHAGWDQTKLSRSLGVRVAVGALVGAMLGLLTGCGSTVKPQGAAQSVVDVVSRQTGFHPTDVHCPSGVKAKAGQEFDCHFTGPEGKPYVAHMRITKVDGDNVEFDIKTRPD
ncbi:hypothetical protein MKUB_26790 [Mycobacterium kubicae]|uniref:DUF4333 domain-containing protein n=1 Tax=Mycobacterium kubicae TaxID=120959 RepID=A0AAX1J2I7_9MYCO|nr:DUF4333 domain-containing protein [Mycobacterium kubicae]MCV7096045.1 DUF4333 domain-containing protein [Mycobacterium kubicae]QNI07200.1 DUF4333 domain-containing protein [Mycobacterium kubicae]QNI12206.1 DUF4333 domain-containing protein [Mycobacterium kubicae]QPI35720.1 DUF4333 domain-containing protein [Mycobacterium kubicae]GFG65189.1 hypothetical protein MKUB_26790 [Mycobacterium kubicae]